ncbi:hypothetical protein PYJP_17080 [Pyrofollis japonicus]|uniref:hypothetical protein n=1 Tax=Pyrofollis japonicus TaxID=3060460 RepID=UPI00295C3A12|nr:hypothetical protein [Pyrofollis japonicus]BEP18356.1 hypothetical protein PYJP_17080 [Pyrofollis japonicus]
MRIITDNKSAINQINLIHNLSWDHLIVLDACRYDYFAKLWKLTQYTVYKAKSPASWTLEWLSSVFTKKFPNTVVFSANPYINNSNKETCVSGICWKAKDKFERVIEVWKIAWSDKLMTVPPWRLYRIVRVNTEVWKRTQKMKRSIIWFIQPHYPYLSEEFVNMLKKITYKSSGEDFLKGSLDHMIRNTLNKIISHNWKLLARMYEDNVKIVLNYVYKLIKNLDGTIVVTSDHGELLGENLIKVIISSLVNIIHESLLNDFNIFTRKSLILKETFHKLLTKKSTARGYFYGIRVFFHPPLLYSSELRYVPLVVID